jgi:hypothetical protein
MRSTTQNRPWPIHGAIGLALIALFWALNWCLTGLRTHLCFFPLWLGYCLAVDALVLLRKGSSLLTRSPGRYAGLFLLSIPGWWLFELINARTGNWYYEGKAFFSDLEYAVLASCSFSTVMPAVFGTAELVSTLGWLRRIGRGPQIAPTPRVLCAFFVTGWAMLSLLLLWPNLFYPFVWLAVYFILAPINVWLGNRSLSAHTAEGDWRPVLALWTGCLICALFWEMWNFYSYPKWVYHVPYVDWLRVFEMPLLGYGGYLPFSLELYALYHLIAGLLGLDTVQGWIQVAPGRVMLPHRQARGTAQR